jgi:hypothetical protein
VWFFAKIWFIVAGFEISVGWGLFMLFIGGMRSLFVVIGCVVWLILMVRVQLFIQCFAASAVQCAVDGSIDFRWFGGYGVVFLFSNMGTSAKTVGDFQFWNRGSFGGGETELREVSGLLPFAPAKYFASCISVKSHRHRRSPQCREIRALQSHHQKTDCNCA